MLNASIAHHFAGISDPRVDHTLWHDLLAIIAITLCAVICGADDWVEVAQFGRSREEWFRSWLKLERGIPSHDTFGRVFARLDAKEFARCLRSWMQAVQEATQSQVVCVDGKSICGSRDSVLGKGAIHMVRAWASQNHLVLGEVKVAEKSNEITAIPELLRVLDLAGCIVTIDAMGCQKAIAQQIVDKGADYVLAVKGNQPQLEEAIEEVFETAVKDEFQDVPHTYSTTLDKGHGRIERRECWATSDSEFLAYLDQELQWPGLRSVAMVTRHRRKAAQDASHDSVETAYYITSLEPDAAKILDATRTHWSIENSLHWTLDVAFREDDCRVRTGNGAQNLSTMRQFTLGLLKRDTTHKVGIKAKRKTAGWNTAYLLHLLNQ